MSNFGRIMLALVRKNNTQPGFWTTVMMVLLLAGLSAWDSKMAFPSAAWFGMIWWLILLSTAAGTGAFSSDLKNDAIRFLEYLPVRRWHIWFANIVDGLLWLGLFIGASVWYRTLHWTPPVYEPEFYSRDPMEPVFFHSRWTLLIGAAGVSFSAFAASAFTRLSIEKDSTAVFRAIVDGMLIVGVVWLAPLVLTLFPALDEVAIPLVLIGLLYMIAGSAFFLFVPRDWGRIRRWLFVRFPMLIVLWVVTLAIIGLMCIRWSKFDGGDVTDVTIDRYHGTENPLLLKVMSTRSAGHLVRVDLDGDSATYLGRGLEVPSRMMERTTVLSTTFAEDGLVWRRGYVRYPTTGPINWRTYLPGDFTHEGIEYKRYAPIWSEDGTRVVFSGHTDKGKGRRFFVSDVRGHIEDEIVMDDYADVLHASRQRLVFTLPNPGENPEKNRTLHLDYLVYDLASGKRTQWRLPGHLLAVDDDLTTALCMQISKGKPSVIRVELPSMKYTVAIESTQLSNREETEEENGQRDSFWWSSPGVVGAYGTQLSPGNLNIAVDRAMRWAVWMKRTPSLRDSTLKLTDLRTGEHRVLLGGEQLRRRTDGKILSTEWMNLEGFTADGKSIVYQNGSEIVRVALADGTRRAMTEPKREASGEYVSWEVSPGRMAVLSNIRMDDGSEWRNRKQTWKISNGDEVRTIHEGRLSGLEWYDDQRLLMTDGGKLHLMDAKTGERKQLYPQP